jgi:hypothetical protein
MRLELLRSVFAIVRLSPDAPVPAWVVSGEFLSVTRTPDELSLVCDERAVPLGHASKTGWRALKVEGPLDFSLIGVLASIAAPLAEAAVPIFVISTYDTDYVLVEVGHLARAITALRSAGHAVRGWD